MKKITVLLLAVLGCTSLSGQKKFNDDGFPIANFALTVNASENGDLFGTILQNTGSLGDWLDNRGKVQVLVGKGAERHSLSQFGQKRVERAFPFVNNTYSKSKLISSTLDLTTFCPLSINDAETSSLPTLLLEIKCTATKNESFDLILLPDSALAKGLHEFEGETLHPFYRKKFGYEYASRDFSISSDSEMQFTDGELRLPLQLKAGETRTVRIALSFYDPKWITANSFDNIHALTGQVYRTWDVLKEKTAQFSNAIPATGDAELDKYLRWYMIPGISLTRYTKNHEALTMGYCELNQRDSYWTSWLHLVLFKDLEQRMIDESVAHQHVSGKIPTTILPRIERHDDLDINAFFILRAARFYEYYGDRSLLRRWLPSLKNAMDWLISRDAEGTGLPMQVSFWGDWKDVTGVKERKYSPFSGLIYLAALKKMTFLCHECNDNASGNRYGKAYDKGYGFINKSTDEGGLWNGNYYCQRWKNDSVNDKILQDQTIGILFDVVEPDRAEKILNTLNANNATPYGIAETFPYYPASFGYKPATYHNGAVWPWLSFMDCWSRLHVGRKAEAIALVKKVAKADLVDSGDWSPNEHINSLTGENLGFRLQGWNAGLFGLVYFGILHPGIL